LSNKIILLSAKQQSVPDLAEIFDRCEATIRTDINRNNTEGRMGRIAASKSFAFITVSKNSLKLSLKGLKHSHVLNFVHSWELMKLNSYLFKKLIHTYLQGFSLKSLPFKSFQGFLLKRQLWKKVIKLQIAKISISLVFFSS